VLRELPSTNPKEVGFQKLLLNCCKEAIAFRKCFSLLWLALTVGDAAFFYKKIKYLFVQEKNPARPKHY
jgi:hypothetical protein